jgi:hypothetical protein
MPPNVGMGFRFIDSRQGTIAGVGFLDIDRGHRPIQASLGYKQELVSFGAGIVFSDF